MEGGASVDKKGKKQKGKTRRVFEVNLEELSPRSPTPPLRGEIFEFIVYIDSCPEKYEEFSDTGKDMYTIYSKCVKQACTRPKGWLTRRQIMDVFDDVINRRMDYTILHYLEGSIVPWGRHDISLDVIDRLVSVYRGDDELKLEGEFSGAIFTIKGLWSEMEKALDRKKKYQILDRDEETGLSFYYTWDQRERTDSEVSVMRKK